MCNENLTRMKTGNVVIIVVAVVVIVCYCYCYCSCNGTCYHCCDVTTVALTIASTAVAYYYPYYMSHPRTSMQIKSCIVFHKMSIIIHFTFFAYSFRFVFVSPITDACFRTLSLFACPM